MKGSEKVIKFLNEALAEEMLAIIQYETQHYQSEETLGYKKLAEIFHKSSLDEMKHLEKLAERIHFLEGKPEIKLPRKPADIGDPKKMVEDDIQAEYDAIKQYNEGIKICWEERDSGTRVLLEEILRDEEGHADEFEIILGLINSLGNDYLATLT